MFGAPEHASLDDWQFSPVVDKENFETVRSFLDAVSQQPEILHEKSVITSQKDKFRTTWKA